MHTYKYIVNALICQFFIITSCFASFCAFITMISFHIHRAPTSLTSCDTQLSEFLYESAKNAAVLYIRNTLLLAFSNGSTCFKHSANAQQLQSTRSLSFVQ